MTTHPTSKLIFDFQDSSGYSPWGVSAVLRLFIADEYDRDPTVKDRLEKWLNEMTEAIAEQDRYAKQLEEWEKEERDEKTDGGD
jgi:hypothetical protein